MPRSSDFVLETSNVKITKRRATEFFLANLDPDCLVDSVLMRPFENYDEIRILNCQHFFSQQTLANLITFNDITTDEYYIKCPVCRDPTPLNRISSNLNNHLKLSLLKEFYPSILCNCGRWVLPKASDNHCKLCEFCGDYSADMNHHLVCDSNTFSCDCGDVISAATFTQHFETCLVGREQALNKLKK